MDKKNYVWIGVGVFAVILAVLLIVKTTSKTEMESTNNNQEAVNTTTETNTAVEPVAEVPTVPLSEEIKIVVDGATFTPKSVKTQLGEKVFMSFEAKDEADHTFGFIDQQLSFIKMPFSKGQGKKSVTFPAPGAGTFTYYIDDQANTGKLIITE